MKGENHMASKTHSKRIRGGLRLGASATLLSAVGLLGAGLLGLGSGAAYASAVHANRPTVSPKHYTGSCPTVFTFTGTITSTSAGTVTYTWIRNDHGVSPTLTLVFATAGTQSVTPSTWDRGVIPPKTKAKGWEKIEILSPTVSTSKPAKFKLKCT